MQLEPKEGAPASPKGRFGARGLARCAFAALVATFALAVATSSAAAAPSVTLNHDWDIEANPAVGVEGTGFVTPTPPPVGLYAAQVAIDDGEVVVGSAQQYIRAGGTGPTKLNTDGTFSSTLNVQKVIGSGPSEVDCSVAQCYVGTWLAHTNPAADSFYTLSPLYFSPTAIPDPADDISPAGETIRVYGGGFDPAMNPQPSPPNLPRGFYVAQATLNGSNYAYGTAQYIRGADYTPSPGTGKNEFKADGTFDTDLAVSGTFVRSSVEYSCAVVQCVIITWPAQSNPSTANVLTSTPISFASTVEADQTEGLAPLGQEVELGGAGFSPAAHPDGLKAALAKVGDAGISRSAASDIELDALGGFADAPVAVAATFTRSGGSPFNPNDAIGCLSGDCEIVVWDANVATPGEADLLARVPVTFSAPQASISPEEITAGDAIAVSGTGFLGSVGLYVSQSAIVNGQVLTPGGMSGETMRWIRSSATDPLDALNPDGTFASSIKPTETFTTEGGTTVDCKVVSCSISTWRQHSVPSVEALFTNSLISFKAPKPNPGDGNGGEKPGPDVEKPKPPVINVGKKKQIKVGRKAKAIRLAAVVCSSTSCTVKKPKRAVLKVGKKKFALKVGGPAKLAQGKRGVIRLRVPAKVAKKLVGRKGRVKFNVVVQSEAGNKKVTINKVLVGAKKVNGKKKPAGKGK